MSPVTAHQLVTLLHFIDKVRGQMESLGQQEVKTKEMQNLIESYDMEIHPEVQGKHEIMKKDMKRLKKSICRCNMERPGLITKLKAFLSKEESDLAVETQKLSKQVEALKYLRVTSDREEVLKMLKTAEGRCVNIRSQADVIIKYQNEFQIANCHFSDLFVVEKKIQMKTLLWKSLFEWEELLSTWQQKEIKNLNASDVLSITQEYRSRVKELSADAEEKEVITHFDNIVRIMEIQIPVLESMTDPTLRERHWEELRSEISPEISSELTLLQGEKMNLHKCTDVLVNVAAKANKQKHMEDKLEMIISDMHTATISVMSGYKKDIFTLGDASSLEHLILKNEYIFHTLLHSKHASHIKQKTIEWKNILTIKKETLKNLKIFEHRWRDLEPVMTTRATKDTFPIQASTFGAIHDFWKSLALRMQSNPKFIAHLRGGLLLEQLVMYSNHLSNLLSCIEPLLAMRRNTCPRLYLLSDQDLLNFLTRAQEPGICEMYLPRIFAGISSLQKSSDGKITALISPQEEILSLSNSVLAHHGVEDWIGRVESAMQATIKRKIIEKAKENTVQFEEVIPVQILNVCRRIQWKNDMESVLAFNGQELNQSKNNSMKNMLGDILQEIDDVTSLQYKELEHKVETTQKSIEKSDDQGGKQTFSKLHRTRKITLFMMKPVSFCSTSSLRSEGREEKSKKKIVKEKLKKTSPLELFENKKSFHLINLLDLRDSTKRFMENASVNLSNFSWICHPKYEAAGLTNQSSGSGGITVKIGCENLDYCYEYYGISAPSISTSSSDRITFNVLAVSSKSMCPTLAGPRNSSKMHTFKSIAKILGQFLSIMECTTSTLSKVSNIMLKAKYYLKLDRHNFFLYLIHYMTPICLSKTFAIYYKNHIECFHFPKFSQFKWDSILLITNNNYVFQLPLLISELHQWLKARGRFS